MIPEAAVEAACEAFYNDPSGLTSWDRAVRVSPEMSDRYRAAMSRALEAAAPSMLAEAWDDGYGHGYKHGKEDCMRLMPGPE